MKHLGKSVSGKDIVTYEGLSQTASRIVTEIEVINKKLAVTNIDPATSEENVDYVDIPGRIFLDTPPIAPKEEDIWIDTADNTMMNLIDKIYPIGSIYISVSEVNPNHTIGGQWQPFGQGKTLVGYNASEAEFNTIEKTGGAKTHTLTEPQLPVVEASWNIHTQERGTNFYTLNGKATGNLMPNNYATGGGFTTGARSYSTPGIRFGANQPHNNLQPYIVTYMWKRIG